MNFRTFREGIHLTPLIHSINEQNHATASPTPNYKIEILDDF
jgi:hypothetical protein